MQGSYFWTENLYCISWYAFIHEFLNDKNLELAKNANFLDMFSIFLSYVVVREESVRTHPAPSLHIRKKTIHYQLWSLSDELLDMAAPLLPLSLMRNANTAKDNL